MCGWRWGAGEGSSSEEKGLELGFHFKWSLGMVSWLERTSCIKAGAAEKSNLSGVCLLDGGGTLLSLTSSFSSYSHLMG